MQILTIHLSTPWAIFQGCNCSHNEERGVCLLITLIAQGFELSLGGFHKKKKTETLAMSSVSQTVVEATSIEVSYFYFFQWFQFLYVLHFK